ncbi:transmembrane protein 62-like [Babylonia areolata]|uniref:transmembrane protein 62-like n=1 Tax=Babylonia areolata TaxID=304850 RepID=UPI003FD05EB9
MKYHTRRCSKAFMMKAFAVVILSVLLVSVLWASFRNMLDPNQTTESEYLPARPTREEGQWPKLDEKSDKIFWIVQVTDVHISKFRDAKRGPDLVRFCQDYLTVIQPSLVLITGDLTDAKDYDDSTSAQFEEEWKEYQHSVGKCKALISATFLDTRGNHDAFDVAELHGKDNLYRRYSMMGRHHALSYHHKHATPFGKYSFIAVDACPIPGPKRPFNFFGYLDDDRVQQVMDLDMESYGSNLTIMFGHYPSSVIVQDPPGIRHIMRNAVAYLCGHLHTLGGFVPNMYSRHKTGSLELELGDWKDNRIFRVLAVDHDLLSFKDAALGDWPLVLVTNPKDAQFLASRHEPTETIGHSTHIRILVFSQREVNSVHVYVDGAYLGLASQASGPLYTLPWNPEDYSLGLHSLRVTVKDDTGYTKSVDQSFSVDGSTPDFEFWPRFVLMVNIFTLSKMVYGCCVFSYVLVLTSLRQCSSVRPLLLSNDGIICVSLLSKLWNIFVYRLWLVARTGSVYYTLLGFLLYITFGPWFVGEFLTGHLGVLFVWGSFIKGTFLTGSLTYFYGIFQILTFNFPLTMILGNTLDLRRQQVSSDNIPVGSQGMTKWRVVLSDLPFSLLLLFQTFMALTEFPRNYGTTAMVISPVRGGSVVVAVVLLYFTHSVPIKKLFAVNGSACCE